MNEVGFIPPPPDDPDLVPEPRHRRPRRGGLGSMARDPVRWSALLRSGKIVEFEHDGPAPDGLTAKPTDFARSP